MKLFKTTILSIFSSIFIFLLLIFAYAYYLARETNEVKYLNPIYWDNKFNTIYILSAIISILAFIIQIKNYRND